MTATLRVRRAPRALRDEARSYRVLLDGSRVGEIKSKEIFEIDVTPGRHAIRLTIDWTGSSELVVDVEDGETLEFLCEPSGSPFSIPLRFFTRSKWISLRAVQRSPSG